MVILVLVKGFNLFSMTPDISLYICDNSVIGPQSPISRKSFPAFRIIFIRPEMKED